MIRYIYIILMLIMSDSVAYSNAYKELEHSMYCIQHFHSYEQKYQIPRDTLHSISLYESGRTHSLTNSKIPWPWAVNVEGKGYHFNSKLEAVSFVRNEISKGKKSIDVGCMQVNLKHHPQAFKSIEDAFNPAANINYGAQFLRKKYEQLGNWHKAIAHYHSATYDLGIPYKNNVIKIARNIETYKAALKLKNFKAENFNYKNPPSNRKYKKFTHDKQQRYRSDMMVHIPNQSQL